MGWLQKRKFKKLKLIKINELLKLHGISYDCVSGFSSKFSPCKVCKSDPQICIYPTRLVIPDKNYRVPTGYVDFLCPVCEVVRLHDNESYQSLSEYIDNYTDNISLDYLKDLHKDYTEKACYYQSKLIDIEEKLSHIVSYRING